MESDYADNGDNDAPSWINLQTVTKKRADPLIT
jgi:hypothetical protein